MNGPPITAKSTERAAPRCAATVGLCLYASIAIAGIADLAGNAVAFSRVESVETLLLWLALGSFVALPAAACAMGLSLALPRRSPSGVAAVVLWAVLQSGILLALKAGWFGVPIALVLSGGLGLASARLARAADPLAAVRTACILLLLASLPAAAIVSLFRPGYGAAGPARARAGEGGERPNVVLIVLDTLRADHLGAYGDPRGLSPGFDALAARSTLYEEAFATAPWTVPSHASLFTGLHPRTHGATCEHHRWLDDRFTTLAEALGERGYETAAFSANHYLLEANLAQGFGLYRPIGERFETLWIRPFLEVLGIPAKWADHGAAEGVEAVERYLGERGATAAPLFLFVNLIEPHWRYLPPLADRRAFLPEDLGVARATLISLDVYGPLLMAGKQVGGPVEAAVRALYAAAVRYQDRELVRLVEAIDAHLDPARTLLVVTSDHGENLGECGRWDHVFAVNDHLIRVPLIVRYPPVFPAGKRIAGLCQLVDVPATIAELVPGTRLGEKIAGRSLQPDRFEPRSFIVAAGDPYYGHLERMANVAGFQRDVGELARPLLAIRSREKKLVLNGRGEPRLVAIARDRDEALDVLGQEPEAAGELARDLEKWLSEVPAYVRENASGATSLTREALERLQRMGYAGK